MGEAGRFSTKKLVGEYVISCVKKRWRATILEGFFVSTKGENTFWKLSIFCCPGTYIKLEIPRASKASKMSPV